MQFYPLGIINFATKVVSASSANLATFLTIPVVPTASIALNFTGPSGSAGNSYQKQGAQGPTGPQGPTGSKGLGVYLLASFRATCSYAQSLSYSTISAQSACDNQFNNTNTYYSGQSVLGLYAQLFTDVRRTINVSTGYYSNGFTSYYVDQSEYVDFPGIQSSTACITGGGGGGGCGGPCNDNNPCGGPCVCSASGTDVIGMCQDPIPV